MSYDGNEPRKYNEKRIVQLSEEQLAATCPTGWGVFSFIWADIGIFLCLG